MVTTVAARAQIFEGTFKWSGTIGAATEPITGTATFSYDQSTGQGLIKNLLGPFGAQDYNFYLRSQLGMDYVYATSFDDLINFGERASGLVISGEPSTYTRPWTLGLLQGAQQYGSIEEGFFRTNNGLTGAGNVYGASGTVFDFMQIPEPSVTALLLTGLLSAAGLVGFRMNKIKHGRGLCESSAIGGSRRRH
jgi:hypothetical protein